MNLSKYNEIPLYAKLIVALIAGAIAGHFLGKDAIVFKPVGALILQVLRLLATPLVFVAIVRALFKSSFAGSNGVRLFYYLLTNTLAAIIIGLIVVNLIQPGHWVHLTAPSTQVISQRFDFVGLLLSKIPSDLIDPFRDNDIISVIVIAFAVGVSARVVRARHEAHQLEGYHIVDSLVETAFEGVMVILQWIFELVPLAVFAVVCGAVGSAGVAPLLSLGAFVGAVVLAMALQACFYLVRLKFGSWVGPARFLAGGKDALTMAFSTASSLATLPVTYASVRDKIGVREESASIGVMVGATFNHDGAALYEAMAALFIAQAIGLHFTLPQQALVVVMAILASLGAAGIPGAGLVTLFAVFSAVRLPTEYVALLLPLDWFLDRCRTVINVMGDMALTCLFDGKVGGANSSLVLESPNAEQLSAVTNTT